MNELHTAGSIGQSVARRWPLLLALTLAGLGIGLAAGLTMTPVYRAEAVVTYDAVDLDQSGMGGALGGLASLAGLAGQGGGGRASALATLSSRELSDEFIRAHNLAPVLFADRWDATAGRWKVPAEKIPTAEDLFRRFDGQVRSVKDDRSAGVIRIAIAVGDRQRVAELANALVALADDKLKSRAIAEAQATLKYLGGELEAAQTTELRAAISKLMQNQLQKTALARSRERFAFNMLDRAQTPDKSYWPKPLLMTVLGALFGLVIGLSIALLRAER